MIGVMLAACSNNPVSTDVEPTPLTDPEAPWLAEDTRPPGEVDLAGVVAAVEDAVTRIATLDAAPLLDAYRRAMDGADGLCPAFYNSDGLVYWLDTCTAASGATFDGYGIDQVDLGVDLDDGLFGDVVTMGGVGEVVSASGVRVTFNGFVQEVDGGDPTDSVTLNASLLMGAFSTDDPSAQGTWLGDGIAPNLQVIRYVIDGAPAVIVEGTLDQLPGDFPTVVFEDAVLIDPQTGATDCADEPSGSASVRLDNGAWVDVQFDPTFDGNAVRTVNPGSCDGCGAAWHRTADLGQVCFDFSPWQR